MMIKVITRHAPSNYGSLLQSIATQIAIEKIGHQCEILDYRRDDECGLKGICAFLETKKNWNSNHLKRFLYIAIKYPCEWLAEHKFAGMRRKYLNLTKRYKTKESLLSEEGADIYMTGSDQVWGPVANEPYDPAYFLSFVKERNKKIAYAGSFGRTDFNEKTLGIYGHLLSEYKYVTVRENSACGLLEKMHVACEGQVLDPTLLLSKEEWSSFITSEVKIKEYVLIYQIHNNPALSDYAKRFAKYVGLPLVRVTPELYQIMRGGKLKLLPDVGKFLSYIKNARYIVTDSFHGTAFSINLNKQFVEVLPNTKTGSRNQSILQLTGLQNRIVKDFDDFSLSGQEIDYTPINEILTKERLKSMSLLKHIIED